VAGTFQDPALDGILNLDLASLRVIANGVRYDDISGVVRFDGRTVLVDSIVAWNGGPVLLTGEVDLAALDQAVLDLDLTASEAQILNNEHGRLWVNANLRIEGPFDGIEISGERFAIVGDPGFAGIPGPPGAGSGRV
jgi:autotransporter translocation and assembly factor TamB